MDEDKAQALYMEFMQLQQQAQASEQQLQGIQEQLRNIEQTRQTIQQLQQLREPADAWVPIAPGAFIKARTKPTDTILLNIGANTAVEKKPEEVIATLEEHAKVLEELGEAAVQELQDIFARLEEIKQQVASEEQGEPEEH